MEAPGRPEPEPNFGLLAEYVGVIMLVVAALLLELNDFECAHKI